MFLTHKAVVRLLTERVPRFPAHSSTGQVKPGTLPVRRLFATFVPNHARGASGRRAGGQSSRRSRPLPEGQVGVGSGIRKTGHFPGNVLFLWTVSRSGNFQAQL